MPLYNPGLAVSKSLSVTEFSTCLVEAAAGRLCIRGETGPTLMIIAGPHQLRSLVSARDANDCAVHFAEFSRINQELYIDSRIGVEGIA